MELLVASYPGLTSQFFRSHGKKRGFCHSCLKSCEGRPAWVRGWVACLFYLPGYVLDYNTLSALYLSQWIAGGGGSCREQLRICDYRRPIQPQNNWVFTQFINYLEATEIFVNASYQYISCINNARRGCSVLHTTAYRYETNRRVGNIARVNPANYLPNEVAVLYLADDENSGNTIATFRPSSSAAGFYLGVQDTGTCGSIERITAYYRVIPSRTDGLIEYPEIPLPPVRSSDTITRSAVCAPHSINSSNLELSADSNGIVEGDPSCLCDPGYQLKPLEDGAAQCIGMLIST